MTEAYCMDCMDALRKMPDKAFELKLRKPIGRTLNVGEIPCVRDKRLIFWPAHTIDGGYVYSDRFRHFRLRHLTSKLDDLSIVAYSFFIIVRAAQLIYSKINRCWHILVEQIPYAPRVKAYKREYVNLSIVVLMSIILSVALDVKNIAMRVYVALRNNPWPGSRFNLNSQQPFSVINKNVIRQPLFTWKGNKALHDGICAHKVFSGLSNLQRFTCSHNITSYILYHKYVEVAIAKSNYYFSAQEERFAAHIAQQSLFVPEPMEFSQLEGNT